MNPALLLPFGAAAVAVVTAAVFSARTGRGLTTWVFSLGLLALAGESVFGGYIASATALPQIAKAYFWQALFSALVPGLWLTFSLTYARGNFRETLGRWRWLLGALVILPFAVALLRNSLTVRITPSPDGATWILNLGPAAVGLNLLQLVAAIAVLVNLERTFQAAVGTMRWRIKFALIGIGVLFIVRLYTTSQALLFRGVDPAFGSLNSGALLLACGLTLRSYFRSGQGRFELKVYPSRTVLQGSLTILLAGIYLVVVGVLAKVVTYFGGDQAFALKAFVVLVALVVLAVLLQSDRVRLLLGRFVSRHFQRPLYDYRRMWKTFTEGTAACVEQADLGRALVRIVADNFQALSVSIWLMDEKKESLLLGASTSLPATEQADGETRRTGAAGIVEYFREHPEPADFEMDNGQWAETLRLAHPSVFPHGGHRIAIPLIGRGELLGVITVGDRVSGMPFSLQDFDMLKCVGDEAAASVLNLQLAQRLLQGKELEAFQTMATFFVHDLKNAASTLNLMLKNLPVHFDDPEFRADALRGMDKTVTHINHLISRLSLLRHELKMKLVDTDLGELVNKALVGLEASPGLELIKDLLPLDKVQVDPEQLAKVVINLVLNAREALPAQNGRIEIRLRAADGRAIISVSDNGCGMSPEFLAKSLFRPFQTTKKSGLGIGMFQSKTIVEAHGGRISAASEPGKGTTFEVSLPLPRP